jgi:hypothetical protein
LDVCPFLGIRLNVGVDLGVDFDVVAVLRSLVGSGTLNRMTLSTTRSFAADHMMP